MVIYRCDLCGEIRDCSQREIEHTEYDICADCWNALASKLNGKGRSQAHSETVTLPARTTPEPARETKPPFPGAPPGIYGSADHVN
jgi:hypothetical protein